MDTVIATAFAAGVISTVNPCGFAMLPAYVGLFLGRDSEHPGRIFTVAASVSAGFVAVFLLVGTLVTLGVRAVVAWIPWVTLLIGGGLIVVGVALLAGRNVLAALVPGVRGTRDRTPAGMFGFGASYGVASLSCTLPIFLSLIAGALTGDGLGGGLLTFGAYALGMTLSVTTITVAIGLGQDRVVAGMRRLSPHIHTIAGWLVLSAGAFMVWYWATVLSSGAGSLAGNPIVDWIEATAARIAGVVAAHPLGATLVAVTLVLLGVAAAAAGTKDEPQ
ncbi:MAG: cytochrome c biogenesis CcdA family protein [Acidimicrobiia bacterium]